MFTVKLYTDNGLRQRILSAESFTILHDKDGAGHEITLHQKNGNDDSRYDIKADCPVPDGFPPRFQKAIIENANGKTTEIIGIALRP